MTLNVVGIVPAAGLGVRMAGLPAEALANEDALG